MFGLGAAFRASEDRPVFKNSVILSLSKDQTRSGFTYRRTVNKQSPLPVILSEVEGSAPGSRTLIAYGNRCRELILRQAQDDGK
jgi:hypothetical protein